MPAMVHAPSRILLAHQTGPFEKTGRIFVEMVPRIGFNEIREAREEDIITAALRVDQNPQSQNQGSIPALAVHIQLECCFLFLS